MANDWQDPSKDLNFPEGGLLEVSLVPAVQNDLARLMARGGYTLTDAVNRSLTCYYWLDETLGNGDYELLFREHRRWPFHRRRYRVVNFFFD